ncbi:hypothetical protein [Petralouisia muris]|uniref:hypothetical protein n=1 Tax=Petralouisia muris TaxID=3032872 RepID=UPI0023B8037A|nr:hypothetical protein [Petralouisia muris]
MDGYTPRSIEVQQARIKEGEFYGIYFNEYRSLKNGQGAELEELPDYLEEKPSFDRKA